MSPLTLVLTLTLLIILEANYSEGWPDYPS